MRGGTLAGSIGSAGGSRKYVPIESRNIAARPGVLAQLGQAGQGLALETEGSRGRFEDGGRAIGHVSAGQLQQGLQGQCQGAGEAGQGLGQQGLVAAEVDIAVPQTQEQIAQLLLDPQPDMLARHLESGKRIGTGEDDMMVLDIEKLGREGIGRRGDLG